LVASDASARTIAAEEEDVMMYDVGTVLLATIASISVAGALLAYRKRSAGGVAYSAIFGVFASMACFQFAPGPAGHRRLNAEERTSRRFGGWSSDRSVDPPLPPMAEIGVTPLAPPMPISENRAGVVDVEPTPMVVESGDRQSSRPADPGSTPPSPGGRSEPSPIRRTTR
jgi:hypothetical protein